MTRFAGLYVAALALAAASLLLLGPGVFALTAGLLAWVSVPRRWRSK